MSSSSVETSDAPRAAQRHAGGDAPTGAGRGQRSSSRDVDGGVGSLLGTINLVQACHVAIEVVVVIVLVLYFKQREQRMARRIDELEQKLDRLLTVLPQQVYLRQHTHAPPGAGMSPEEVRNSISHQQRQREQAAAQRTATIAPAPAPQPAPQPAPTQETAPVPKPEADPQPPPRHVRFAMPETTDGSVVEEIQYEPYNESTEEASGKPAEETPD